MGNCPLIIFLLNQSEKGDRNIISIVSNDLEIEGMLKTQSNKTKQSSVGEK